MGEFTTIMARPAGCRGEPGLKFVAVPRHDGGEFAHGVAF